MWRLGKVRDRAAGLQAQRFALVYRRQPAAFAILCRVFILGGDLVCSQVTIELHHRAGGPEGVIGRGDIDGGLIKHRRNHLGSYEPLPDKLIEPE